MINIAQRVFEVGGAQQNPLSSFAAAHVEGFLPAWIQVFYPHFTF